MIAAIDPVVFASTSKISAFLLIVNNPCIISTPIPYEKESKNTNSIIFR